MQRFARWQIRLFFGLWMLILWRFATEPFTFLLLNTFLGYIPIEISFHLGPTKPKNHVLFWIIFVVWLLFYPNAPYLLTDLFHLSLLHAYSANGLLLMSVQVWVNFTLMLISTLFCVILGFWSLQYVASSIAGRYFSNNFWTNSFIVFVLTTLTSIGIYAGRFQRIHTIYLFISPELIVHRLLTMWTLKMLVFVLLMTVIQLLMYWLFTLIFNANNRLP